MEITTVKLVSQKLLIKQECIPVGCALSTAVAVLGSGFCLRGVSAQGMCAWGCLPEVVSV